MTNTNEAIFIYGKNAVLGALKDRPDTVERVFIERGKNFEKKFEDTLYSAINSNKITKEVFGEAKNFGREFENVNHQGIFAKVKTNDLTINFEYFIENLEIDPNTCLLILGELQDPTNVGSIIRTAAAFGIAGILIPEHNQAQVNGTVVKISAGSAFTIPLVKIGNVNNAIEKLKEKRFWIYGLDMFGEKSIYEEKYTEPTVFVVGSEGEGIREKTKEGCDMLLNIPISEKVESLNAAVSTAVTIAEWRRQKSFTN